MRIPRVHITQPLAGQQQLTLDAGPAHHLLKVLRPFARQYPMTLAETASIFAEHILADGIYADESISDSAKLQMLDADLNGASVLLLDITTRYEFEKAFHEYMAAGNADLVNRISTSGDISAEDEEAIRQAVADFKGSVAY